jgi:hypothetical protein
MIISLMLKMGKMTKVELLNMNLVVKGFDSILEVLDSIFNSIIKKREK